MHWPWNRTRHSINALTVAVCRLREELREGFRNMTLEVQDMITAVTELKGQVASIVGLVGEMADLFEAEKEDPAAITSLAADVRAQSKAIAEAVLAHPLPSDPPVEPPPVEPPV